MVNRPFATLATCFVVIATACGAPELTYRDGTPVDAGADGPSDDVGTDAAPDVEADTAGDVSNDVMEDVVEDVVGDIGIDVVADVGQDVTGDVAQDVADAPADSADVAAPCPASMVAVPLGDGSEYCIDTHEVTQQAYASWLASSPTTGGQPAACVGNDSFEPNLGACSGGSYDPTSTPDLPVTCIDWCDAAAYCSAMSLRLCGALAVGGPAKYNKFADADESQWMRACSNAGGRAYPYGDSYEAGTCNGADYAAGGPVAAGSTSCTGAYGALLDMSGNVAEWEDCCAGAAPTASCHIRGGSFLDEASALRCDASAHLERGEVSRLVGFRCCRD